MRKHILLIAVIMLMLILSSCKIGSWNQQPETLNILSFNVYSGSSDHAPVTNADTADMRIENRAGKLNDILLGENISIAGLQEVNPAWQNWLNEGLDPAYAYVGTATEATREGGYIVYHKDFFTLITDGVFWLADGAPSTAEIGWDSKYDRLCSWALFQLNRTDNYILFMNTHLDHKGTLARKRSSKLILEQIEELNLQFEQSYQINSISVILTGDMNAEPKTSVYRTFAGALTDTFHAAQINDVEEKASTSPGLYQRAAEENYVRDGHRIDYIFISNESFDVASYKMLHTATNLCPYGEYISDHNAVIAQLIPQ